VLFLGGSDDDRPADRAAGTNTRDERPQRSPKAVGGASPATSPAASPAASPASPAGEIAVPEGWVPYTGLPEGFAISYPQEWRVRPRSDATMDFDDPVSNTYLRVAWVSPPSSDDPVAKAKEIEQGFRSRYPTYYRVRLEPATFKDRFKAVDWEYTYSADGAQLHATNLQFITGDYGFALNFQTAEADWEESQTLFEQFQATFTTP